jgi:hypothetical protein
MLIGHAAAGGVIMAIHALPHTAIGGQQRHGIADRVAHHLSPSFTVTLPMLRLESR